MAELPGPLPPPQREWLQYVAIEVLLAAASEGTVLQEQGSALERFIGGGLSAVRVPPTPAHGP